MDSHTKLLNTDEQEWLEANADRTEVLFGYQAPPNAFHNEDGEYVGLLVDVLEEIAAHLGTDFKYRNFTTWDELVEYAKTGQGFIIVGIARTEARSEFLSFTDSFIKIPYVIITRQDSTLTSIEDFTDRVVCTVANYAVNDYLLEHHPQLTTTAVPNNLIGLQAVSTGVCEAMVINQMYATHLIHEQGITNLRIAGESGYLNRLSAATSINDPALFRILDKAVDQIDTRRRKALYDPWVHPIDSDRARFVSFVLAIVIGLALVALLLLWLRFQQLRKQASVELAISEKKYRDIVGEIPDLVFRTDEQGLVLFVSPSVETITGFSADELAGTHLSTKICPHPEMHALFLATIQKHGVVTDFETEMRRKDGSTWQGSTNAHVLKNGDGVILGIEGVTRDVTAQQAAQSAMLNAEREARRLAADLTRAQQVASIGSWSFNVADGQIKWSQQMFEIFGRDLDTVKLDYECLLSWVHPEDRPRHDRYMQQILNIKPGEDADDLKYRLIRPNGEQRWVEVTFETEFDELDKPMRFFGTLQDITDRTRVEEALERESERARLILNTTQDGYILTDADGQLYDVNPAYCHMVGYTRDQLLTMKISQLDSVMNKQEIAACLPSILDVGHTQFETRHRHRDGHEIDLEVNVAVMRFDASPFAASFVRDITKRKQIEANVAEQINELRRWQEVTLGREGRVLELKQEVNSLLSELDRPTRYHSAGKDGERRD